MNDRPRTDPREHTAEALPGFYGGEDPSEAEPVDPAVWSKIDEFLSRHPGGAERLIPVLRLAQETAGYLSIAIQEQIAERLGLPLVQLYGVVSFDNYFNTTPRAKYQLEVCMGTACFVRRARELTESIRQVLGVDVGRVTKDRLFGLEEVRCLGSCGLAPVMRLNGDTHGNVSARDARRLILGLRVKARRESLFGSTEEPHG